MASSAIFIIFCAFFMFMMADAANQCYVPSECRANRLRFRVCGSNRCSYDNEDVLDCIRRRNPRLRKVDRSYCPGIEIDYRV